MAMPTEPSWVHARSGRDADLIEMGESLRKAELRGDVAFMDRILAPDFLGIGPRGFILDKEGLLARHRSGDLRYEAIERDEVSVRTYGDAAIMTGRERTRTRYNGQEVPGGQFRTTHVFVRQEGGWRLVGVQMSPIVQGP